MMMKTQFSSIWLIDRTLSDATTLGQSELGSDSNEEVLHITQSSSITGTSPSDCLLSYQDTQWEGAYPSADVQSMYSTVPADWARFTFEQYCIRTHPLHIMDVLKENPPIYFPENRTNIGDKIRLLDRASFQQQNMIFYLIVIITSTAFLPVMNKSLHTMFIVDDKSNTSYFITQHQKLMLVT